MKTTLVIVLSVVLSAGAFAANQLGAQTMGTPPASTVLTQDPTLTAPTATSSATIQNIVEVTRLVPAGAAAVTAFTVPAGVVLVVTDLVITNTGTAPTCGGAVNRTTPTSPTTPTSGTPAETTGSTPSALTTPAAGTLTQTDSTLTGPLCVPAQTTTTLPLTTGIEFAAGQSVQLMNTPDPATPAGTTSGSLAFHLRGLLVTLS